MKTKVIFFALGALYGGIVAGIAMYQYMKNKKEEQESEEIAELRKYYQEKLEKYEPPVTRKNGDVEVVNTIDGIPEGSVNTQEVRYDSIYERVNKVATRVKEEAATAHPSEDDDDDYDDRDIYEITEQYDNLKNEPGFGERKGYDWVNMLYYTKSGNLAISEWSPNWDRGFERSEEQIKHEEEEIISDISPFLEEIDFAHQPYDVTYLRDKNWNVDCRITKVYRYDADM